MNAFRQFYLADKSDLIWTIRLFDLFMVANESLQSWSQELGDVVCTTGFKVDFRKDSNLVATAEPQTCLAILRTTCRATSDCLFRSST